jgi:hypothetical protein
MKGLDPARLASTSGHVVDLATATRLRSQSRQEAGLTPRFEASALSGWMAPDVAR